MNVLKPPGMTSSNVVSELRHIFDMKRVGHTGTLDPGAAGVLPVWLGRATRLFDHLVDKRKEYIALLTPGLETDTEDSYGAVTASSDIPLTAEDMIAVLPRFTGELRQTAPMYSSVRVDGKQMYKLARSGQNIADDERRVRDITVYGIEYLGEEAGGHLLRIECGKGTYIRTLVRDIARAAGGMGYMAFLLRTGSGMFRIEDSVTLEELRVMKERGTLDEAVISVERSLSHLGEARLTLGAANARRLTNGADIPYMGEENVPVRVYIRDEFIGIGCAADGRLHITTYFREADPDV